MSGKTSKKQRKKDSIESFIGKPPLIIKQSLSQLRYLVLVEGVKEYPEHHHHPYRAFLWSILLRTPSLATCEYMSYVRQGPSHVYAKIRNDTFRTLATDQNFQNTVSEDALIRTLNCFAWKQSERISSGTRTVTRNTDHQYLPDCYVQGMNVIAAPFLYVCRSEAQAFALFDSFIINECPQYVRPTLEGVHTGLLLLDLCLEIVDPELFTFLKSKYLSAELYAFAFSACTPPLSQVLHLWDILFSYGPHMNILFVIAQLNLMRDTILSSKSPMALLRSFPPLRAKEVTKLGISFIEQLPQQLYDMLTRHTRDPTVRAQLKKV